MKNYKARTWYIGGGAATFVIKIPMGLIPRIYTGRRS